jgi:hypothetical protein
MEAIQELIDAGTFPDVSAFLLAVVREKLEACSAGACRAVDERAERHEIKEYFKTKGRDVSLRCLPRPGAGLRSDLQDDRGSQ